MRKKAYLLSALTSVLFSGSTYAQSDAVMKMCEGSDVEVSIAACTSILNAKDMTPEMRSAAYHVRGRAYKAKGDLKKAHADFTAAIAINSKSAHMSYVARGELFAREQKDAEALSDFGRALTLNPNSIEALRSRATLQKFDKTALAIVDFTKLIELQPTKVEWYLERGNCYSMVNNHELARADFSKAISLEPKNVLAHADHSDVFAQQGNIAKAEAGYAVAIALTPEKSFPYYRKGFMYKEYAKNPTKAKLAFEEALRIEPKSFHGMMADNEITKLLEEAKDFDTIIAKLSEQLAEKPSDVRLLLQRSEVHLKKDDSARAMQDVEKVLSLEPRSADAYTMRAKIFTKAGDEEKAIADHKAAVKLNPNQFTSRLLLLAHELKKKSEKQKKEKQ